MKRIALALAALALQGCAAVIALDAYDNDNRQRANRERRDRERAEKHQILVDAMHAKEQAVEERRLRAMAGKYEAPLTTRAADVPGRSVEP